MALSNRSTPFINSRRLALLLASTALVAGPAAAATYNVTDEASLIAAINAANASAGSDTIVLSNAITLTGALPTITDITTVDTANYQLSMPSGSLTFSGAGTLNLANGGQVTGSGVGNSVTFGNGLATLIVASGATIDGNISAAASGAINVTTSGSLNGTLLGSNNADTLAINGGSFGGATLGNGNDLVTFRGGTIAGTINGGGGSFGGDRFTAAIGSGNTASVDLTNLRGFGGYALTSGTLAMSGVGQTQADWTVTSGASVDLSGALHGYNWALSINGNNNGSAVNITPTGSIDGYVGVYFNGAPTNSLTNAGSISTTQVAVTTNGRTTINNSGTIASSASDGISTGFSVATIVNSGTISGSTSGVTARFSAINVTNQAGGLINGTTVGFLGGTAGYGGLDTLTNASGAGITGATAISIAGNSGLTLNNSGQVIGSTTAINTAGSGAVNITNNAGGVIATGTLASAGATYVSGTGTAITVGTGGTISNAGTIAGTTAIDFAGAGTITNLSGGVISGTTSVGGTGLVNLNFNAGSTADGVTLTGSGQRNVAINGTIGAFDASAATGAINVTVGATATLASLALGSGNDIFTNNGATIAGAVDGGAGTDTYTIAVATGQSRTLDLGSALTGTTNFELLGKTGGGTLTINGTLDPSIQGIVAGDGGNNDGLLIFDGTSGLTAAITVNGAIIRANTAGAFGTGTIRTIDPTIQYAATGTYSNNILLAVPAPASGDPTRLEALNASVDTLTGAITSDPAAGANQYVTIGGNGTIVLTNTANAWTGVTTVDAGATLRGTSGTISGGSIVDNGTLAYVQSASGTVARAISGSGVVNVSGLGAGNALTFSGTNSVANGFNVTDGSALILSGANSGSHNVTLGGNNAALTVTSSGALTSTGANGISVTGTNDSVTNQGSVSGVVGLAVSGGGLTLNNNAGATLSGSTQAFQSTGLGATTINNSGDITGGIVSTGGGNLIIDNAASGNIVRVPAGSAIDLSNGGALTLTNAGDVVGSSWGIVGRNANDSVTNSGRIAAGTISGNTITSGGTQGIVLLSGGSINNLAGGQILGTTAVSGGGTTSVTNAGSITARTGSFNSGVSFSGAGGSTLVNQAGGTITGGRGVSSNNAVTITNAGTITSNCAAPSFQCAAIILFNGGTITNAATGVITSSGRGIGAQGTVAGTVINNGLITSTLANDIAVILFGGGSITNNATGTIANANGYGAYLYSTAGSITNAGAITGKYAVSIDSTSGTVNNSGSIVGSDTGVAGYNATLGLTNSGQISGGTYGVFGNTGATNVTNLSGGTIASSGGAGIYTTDGPLTVDNQAGASINGYNDGIRTGGTANVTNGGMIVATNGSGVNAGGALTLNNSGTINGGNSGLFLNAGGTVINSGSISSGVAGANRDGISAFGALNLTNSGSISASENAGVVAFDSLLTVNNQAGGTITGGSSVFGFAINAKAGLDLTNGGMLSAGSGTTTAVLVDGAANINLLAGSITNGDIVATGGGSRAINVDGALYGSIDSSDATSNSFVTLGSTGSLTNVLLGAGNDLFTNYGGTISGTIDGGAGNDRFTANVANGVSTSLDLGSLTAFEAIEKLGFGTLTLTGTAASPDAAIFAGNGYDDDGLLIFDGTTGLTGDIYVNGAIIRANTAGAFGTGTIHTIDPTVQYAATGTYSNNILLSVAAPASADPTRLEALNSAVATLTGAITSDPAADPDQYVTIGGNGTIVLTNTANAWTGTTTIDSGATLRGASDTISGGNIVDNGTIAYVQPTSGTVAQAITGTGNVTISGLGIGQSLAFSGTNNVNRFEVLDGSALVLSGANTVGEQVSLDGPGASLTVTSTGSLVSNFLVDVAGYGAGNIVNNQGSITGAGLFGVALYSGGTVINGSASNGTALIEAGQIGAYSGDSPLSVDNYGIIRGINNSGVVAGNLTLTNRAGGQIIGQGDSGNSNSYGAQASGTLSLDNAGQIVGRYVGVRSENTINLTNSGLIGSGYLSGTMFSYSDGNDGIQALNGGTINNLAGGQILGSISGIYTSGGAISVTNAGLINGANANGNGGFGIYTVGGGLTLNNLAGGTINGATNGIADLTGNGLVITNAGTISGDTAIFNQTNGATINNIAGGQLSGVTQAIVANAAFTLTNDGSVTANNIAIRTSGGGTIINHLGGTISGGTAAFQSTGVAASTITNSGDITGGVGSTGGGNLDITNNASGNIVRVVFGSAIDMSNGGRLTLTNAGDIVGSGWGVVGRNAGDVITNSGRIASGTISGNTITVSGANAIELQQGGSVTNLAGGQITGQGNGITGGAIIVDNRSGALISGVSNAVNIGANSLVTNAGTITGGTANFNAGVSLGANSTVTNLVGGTITGARATLFNGANDVLTNSGTINSTAATASQGYGALFFNGGTVNNLAGGSITGQYRGVSIQGVAGSVTNAGTIRSSTEIALLLFNGGSVTNQSGGLIDGQVRGIYIAGGLGTVTNAGTIRATVDNGVSLFGGGTVNNQLGGTITALGSGGWGIYATGGAVNLTNAGLINADTGIVTNANGAIVTNSGTINGTLSGVMSYTGTSQSLTNSGTITATNGAGVNAGGALTLDNSGTIRTNSANPVDGVTVFNGAAATITNSGTISAANASGTAVTGASSITNSGTLTGGNNASFGYGAQFAAGSSGSLVNQSGGTIGGGTGSVLVATDNAVSIDLQAGSTANGAILSTGAGARSVNVAGALNGVYNAAGGTGLDTFTLASTGSLGGALLGAANDSFTTLGGAISGNVDGGAGTDSLLFNVAGSVTYAGNFTGFETGTKTGAGLVNLTGNSIVTAMGINGGTLAINGSLASNVSVNSGAKLGGNGLITGSLSILSGGILAPGNSIGHLTVNGPLSFAAGSIYQVETTPTAADSVSATGNITIGGGTVQVLATGTAYSPLTRYTILDTPTAVTGTFANITSNLAFLTPGLEYNPRSVVLVLRRNDINFTDVAANPNQAAVAGAVQSLGVSPLFDAVLVQSADGARQAYDALSGEVYASTQTAILGQRDRLQDAMASNRLRSDGMSLWIDAGKSWGTFDQSIDRGNAVTTTDTHDLLGGFNWTRGPIAVTLGGGRVIEKIEIDDRDSKAKAKSWLFGGQVAYGAELGFHAVAGGNYASHKVSTDRSIIFPGFAETASSGRGGNGYHLFGQLGYASQTAGITIEPFVGIARDHLKLDATSETGGLAALDIGSTSRNLTTAQFGFKLSAVADLGWAKLTPRTSIALQHVMGDITGRTTNGFQSGGIDFDISGAALARNAAKVGLDLDFDIGAAKVIAGYTGTIGGVASEHTAKVAFQLKF